MPPLLAFTGLQVGRLTQLSQRTLRYWEETGVFRASYVDERPHRPYRRIYSFRDVVSLQTLAVLRRTHNVGLDELRRVGEYLTRYCEAPWAEMRFRVFGRHVAFRDPCTGTWVSSRPLGQVFIEFALEDIRHDVEAEAAKFRERDPSQMGQIVRHRHVLSNSWVVAGTRVPTSAIWHFHEAGYDTSAILREYPRLTPADVDAALEHERQQRGLIAA